MQNYYLWQFDILSCFSCFEFKNSVCGEKKSLTNKTKGPKWNLSQQWLLKWCSYLSWAMGVDVSSRLKRSFCLIVLLVIWWCTKSSIPPPAISPLSPCVLPCSEPWKVPQEGWLLCLWGGQQQWEPVSRAAPQRRVPGLSLPFVRGCWQHSLLLFTCTYQPTAGGYKTPVYAPSI